MRKLFSLLIAVPFIADAQTASDAPTVTFAITVWTGPREETRPRYPCLDKTWRVSFVGQSANYSASLDSKSGESKPFEIEEGTHPHNLIVGADGGIWYAGNPNGR